MRVYKKIGTKERLFEMFENVNNIKINESKKVIKESLYYDYILQGSDATEENAIETAQGLDWQRIETEEANYPDMRYVDTINGVGIYYQMGSDSYYFTDELMGENFDSPMEKDKEYLDKTVGDESSQVSKYDDGTRYPVEDKLKVNDPSLEKLKGDDPPITEDFDDAPEFKPQAQLDSAGGYIEVEIDKDNYNLLRFRRYKNNIPQTPIEAKILYDDGKPYFNDSDSGTYYLNDFTVNRRNIDQNLYPQIDEALSTDDDHKNAQADEFKKDLKKNYSVRNTADLSPEQNRELKASMGFDNKEERPEYDDSNDMTQADREEYAQRDKDMLIYLAKNADKITDLDSYESVANAYSDESGETMMHPMAVLAAISQVQPYTDFRDQLKNVEDVLIQNMPNPEKTQKSMSGYYEDESITESEDNQDIANDSEEKPAWDEDFGGEESSDNKDVEEPEMNIDDIPADEESEDAPELDNEIEGSEEGGVEIDLETSDGEEINTDTEEVEAGFEDQIEGGMADDVQPHDFCPVQIAKGIQIEMEHTDDPKMALEIAMDHLTEIPDYYSRLENMEADAKGENAMSADDEGAPEDSLLDPSKHWVDDYSPQNVSMGDEIEEDYPLEGGDPEAGEEEFEFQEKAKNGEFNDKKELPKDPSKLVTNPNIDDFSKLAGY